ncbi:S-layer homology domain-containing protein [Paenibacillus sp. TRM 82003]|nr:S-layer homology domain-containing protein [Paenibacillus sp. TRM 82003]
MKGTHLYWVIAVICTLFFHSETQAEATQPSGVLISHEGRAISNVNLILSDLDSSGHYAYRGVDVAIFESANGSPFTVMDGKVKRVLTDQTRVQVELGGAAEYESSTTYKIGYRVLYSPVGVDPMQMIVAEQDNGKDGWALARDADNREISFAVSVPPNAPESLIAVPGDGQVALQWSTVTGATYYRLYQGTESGVYGPVEIATVTSAAYHVTSLVNGTTYYFAIKASNAAGEGPLSNEVSAMPRADLPPALTAVRLSSSNPDAAFAKPGDQATLTFRANEALNGLPTVAIAGREATVADAGNNNYAAVYTFTGGEAEGLVTFSVDYADKEGNVGPTVFSTTDNSRIVFDKTAPTAPDYVISSPSGYKPGDIVAGDVTLTIASGTDDGGSGVRSTQYRSRWNGEPWDGWKEYTNSLALTQPGTTEVQMKTLDRAGNESEATLAQIVIGELTAPSRPTLSPGIAGDGQVTLSWDTVTGATYYSIYQGTVSGQFGAAEPITVTGETYRVTSLTNGLTYYFVIKASNAAGDSPLSNEISAMPRADSLPALTSVSLSSSNADTGLATTGDRVTLTLQANKALNGVPTVTIAGRTVSVTSMGGDVYKAAYTFTGTEHEGVVEFTVDFVDASGNVGSTVSTPTDSSRVIYDKTAPSGTLSINNGAAATTSDAVTLSIASQDGGGSGMARMRLSNDMSSWSPWEAAAAAKDWTLSAGEGTKTVYLQLMDAAGNVTAQPITDSIVRQVATPPAEPETEPAPGIDAGTGADIVIAEKGRITVPAGKKGEVSLGEQMKISIPAGVSEKELILTIEEVLDTQSLSLGNNVLASPIFEILKSFSENFSKPVTLSFAFDPNLLKENQRAAVFYYDEAKREWVEVEGGKITGNRIAVEVDHFTKFAVFAVDLFPEIPVADMGTDAGWSDIAGHWAEATIMEAVKSGIVAGYPDGTFKPNRLVTRAEFAVLLMNTFEPEAEGAEFAFVDAAEIEAWARTAVGQAVQAGVIRGYPDGTFRPNEGITRAEMAVLLANAIGATVEADAASGFADDKDIPSWARGAVHAMQRLGLVQGNGANEYAPNEPATRAEAVTILLNALVQS